MTELKVQLSCPLPRFHLELATEWHGRTLGIFGVSGSGKTTLLEHLIGLRRDGQGTLSLDGRLLVDSARGLWVPPEERKIGYVPQDGLLFPHWTVMGNLLLGRRRTALGREQAARLDELIELLDLSALISAQVTALSGGERRRVSLARALLQDPVLLCLDEPLSNLDAPRRQGVLAYLIGLRKWSNVPLVVVSHDATDLLALTEEAWRLEQGKIVDRGPTWKVLARQDVLATPEHVPQTVLPGTMRGREGQSAHVVLDCGIEIHGTARAGNVGDAVAVTLNPTELLVAREIPPGISARNRLPARILERRHGPTAGLLLLCEVAPETAPLWVLVTDEADSELHLHPGASVYLLFKASACPVTPIHR